MSEERFDVIQAQLLSGQGFVDVGLAQELADEVLRCWGWLALIRDSGNDSDELALAALDGLEVGQ